MRRTLRWTAAALTGAAIAVLGVLASAWWVHRNDPDDFGWSAYSPLPNATAPRRYVDYLPTGGGPSAADWARVITPAALAGAVLGLLVLAVVVAVRRRVTRSGAAA